MNGKLYAEAISETVPHDFDHNGIAGCGMAECVFGMFGEQNATGLCMKTGQRRVVTTTGGAQITGFSSGEMSSCSALFLHLPMIMSEGVFGAVMHFSGIGEPDEALREALTIAGLNNAANLVMASVYLAYSDNTDMTSATIRRSLAREDLAEPSRFKIYKEYLHKGAACMDINGNIFNHYHA